MAEKDVQSRKRKLDSIETLQKENTYLPNSPKKCTNTLQCGVLTKSPVKPTARGHMFTMRLCDQDPMTNARAVCYDADKFELFQSMKTYTIDKFKVKRGYGSEFMEILIDDDTVIESSDHQFKMERCSYEIAQIVRGETLNIRFLNVKGKVMDIGEVNKVGRYPDLKEKRKVVLADKSGHITLVLWRDRANDIGFNVGDTVIIENCVVSTFNKVRNITTAFETTINKLSQDIEVTSPMPVKPKPSSVAQKLGKVTAIKEYKCKTKCPNCNIESDIDTASCKTTDVGCIAKCQHCKTIFMVEYGQIYNECKFLIEGTWYTAKKSVVDAILGKTQNIQNPTEDQILKLMNTKYSLTLNTCARKIEAAQPIDDEESNPEQDTQEDEHQALDNLDTDNHMDHQNTEKLKSD